MYLNMKASEDNELLDHVGSFEMKEKVYISNLQLYKWSHGPFLKIPFLYTYSILTNGEVL